MTNFSALATSLWNLCHVVVSIRCDRYQVCSVLSEPAEGPLSLDAELRKGPLALEVFRETSHEGQTKQN